MIKHLTTTATALALAASVSAQQPLDPARWNDAKPSTAITVVAGSSPELFQVRAVVTDLATSAVLAKPVLVIKAGQPATVEIGSQTRVSIRFVVTVDPSGQTAQYTSEVKRDGKVESATSSTLAVERT